MRLSPVEKMIVCGMGALAMASSAKPGEGSHGPPAAVPTVTPHFVGGSAPPFQIGGRNSTLTIRALTQIRGVPIGILEQRMRPGNDSPLSDGSSFERSDRGFLGPRESLVQVMAEDNDLVLGQWGLTHQALAAPLLDFLAQARNRWAHEQFGPFEVRYPIGHPGVTPSRYRVFFSETHGQQPSPFLGRYSQQEPGSASIRIENLSTGKFLETSEMVPALIRNYGFYEGKGTPYRLYPQQILAVFDYLRPPDVILDLPPGVTVDLPPPKFGK
jgi:hypothetical protein